MSRTFRTACLAMMPVVSLIAEGAQTMAHEGHGHPEHQHGVSHYVVNASHALPIMIGVALILAGAFFCWRSRSSSK